MSGNVERCPICGSGQLIRYGSRPEGACSGCHAKERTRTIYLILRKLNAFDDERSVLHIAPEKPLVEKLRSHFGGRYTICDIRPKALALFPDNIHKMVVDLTSLDPALDSMKFDVVIHSHVMEHVRASWPLVFMRLHALLQPGGLHVFAVPLLRNWSKEDLVDMAPEVRRRIFGQDDHFRFIGRSDFEIDMQNIVALTHSQPLVRANSILSQSEMVLIAGDPDVYVLRKAASYDQAPV
jgi:phosphoglycolate phosphatase